MKIIQVVLFALLSYPTFSQCSLADNFVMCNGHIATQAELGTLLGEHSYSPDAIPRDSRGRIARSPSARKAFMQQTICPATGAYSNKCPGYVVDHVRPLACGGPDDPSNMQFQTKADAKEKDKWERKTCGGQ